MRSACVISHVFSSITQAVRRISRSLLDQRVPEKLGWRGIERPDSSAHGSLSAEATRPDAKKKKNRYKVPQEIELDLGMLYTMSPISRHSMYIYIYI